jgi:hypothetical protein
MLAVEVWAHWFETSDIKWATVVLFAATLFAGLFHGAIARVQERRSLTVTADGVRARRSAFSKFEAKWPDLAAIDIVPRQTRLVRKDGADYVLNFESLHNATAVRDALESAQRRLLQT